MLTKDIYAYYVEFGNRQEPPLIDFWIERWKREGWNPVILGDGDSQRDTRYNELSDKVDTFPMLPGQAKFGKANFMRWLAFSHIHGVVTDYDVFPLRTFPPADFGGFVCGDDCGGPGFIVGTGKDFSGVVETILSYNPQPDDTANGVAHVCDMRLLHKTAWRYDRLIHNITCYGVTGWESRPLVHFGNAYMKPYHKQSRVDQIRDVLQKIYP